MNQQLILGSYGGFSVDSADFDGTNDYMTRGSGLTGAADSKKFILSFWFRLDATGSQTLFCNAVTAGVNSARFTVFINASNKLVFTGISPAGGVPILSMGSSTSYTSSSVWHLLLCSCDMASPSTSFMYIDDVNETNQSVFTNSTIDFTTADWVVGAIGDGANKFNGCLSELYFSIGEFMNISVEANRRKFISASSKPVYLGSDGAVPTGTAPIVYQHLGKGVAVAGFATNRGTGGDFSITGTLDTGSTSPSD